MSLFRRSLPSVSRAHLDAAIIFALCVPVYVLLSWLDAFDALYEFSRAREDWELDEIFALAMVAGLGCGIFGLRRLLDLKAEVARRQAAEADATNLARHDILTGLPNRRQFLDEAIRQYSTLGPNDRVGILLVDLDHFKPVNDLYGHRVGDAVLCQVAARLTTAVDGAGMVARLGGDEFGILIRSDSVGDSVERVARRVVHEIAEPIREGALVIRVGASIGITLAARDTRDEAPTMETAAEQLQDHLRHADLAMYRAKIDGRGQYSFFERSMDDKLKLHLRLEKELPSAISEGEIIPYYQPLVDLVSKEVVGYEVLARWQHPALGLIPPADFIAIAEDTGLISRLSVAILEKAVEDAKSWPNHTYLSINISPKQLANAWLAEEILGVLSRSGFPPTRLEVEITETGLVEKIDVVKGVLSSLRNVGIRIALDDFGTGYSSLYHLRELSIDTIKIDRSFVTNMLANPEEERIVEAVIHLSHAMGIRTIAEGIESADVGKRLQQLGCDVGQGYHFGRPQQIQPKSDQVLANQNVA